MKIVLNVMSGLFLLAVIAGQVWIFYIIYQIIGWFVLLLIAGAIGAGCYWKPPNPNRRPTPFYDDYPDIG